MNGILYISVIISLCFVSFFSGAKELPVENFSQLPSYTRPTLSPSGNQIAFIRNYLSPEMAVLTTIDLVTGKKQYIVRADNIESKIRWFKWANEKTLLVSQKVPIIFRNVKFSKTMISAIDIDGEKPVVRDFTPSGRAEYRGQFQDNVVSFLPNDPDHILLEIGNASLPGVYKFNIYTQESSRVTKGKLFVESWMADRQGRLRLGSALNTKTGEGSIRYRVGDDDSWHKIFEYNALEEPGITPLGFAKDPNILYYSAFRGDKKALFKIDLRSKQSTLVFSDEERDVDGSLIYSKKTNDVIGIRHSNSKDGRVYWDTSIKKFQKSLNAALPDSSVYLVDFSQDENVYLLYTENDYTPGAYFLGDRKDKSISLLFEQYPLLVPEYLTEHKLVSYTARDGTEIEGYLTLPTDPKGPVPAILHPHGGPGARDYAGFDYWTSFFANRGYAVFRPNFRGSTGYGYEFAQSQMQGWGLTMQDDLTDAAQWLQAERIAKPKEICIVGASYGGYAAAMAAVKTPDTFKCAISFAGVTDLNQLVRDSYKFTNTKFVQKQIGNSRSDLKARSPYYHAEKVKIPMLFIHGENDLIVDVKQSRIMVDELEDYDKPVEYIELENGDHHLSLQKNRHIAFKAMDAFLKKHLSEQ